jgi:hypothetical protein
MFIADNLVNLLNPEGILCKRASKNIKSLRDYHIFSQSFAINIDSLREFRIFT